MRIRFQLLEIAVRRAFEFGPSGPEGDVEIEFPLLYHLNRHLNEWREFITEYFETDIATA